MLYVTTVEKTVNITDLLKICCYNIFLFKSKITLNK